MEKRIRSETDLETLGVWLKKAARASTVEEFEQEIVKKYRQDYGVEDILQGRPFAAVLERAQKAAYVNVWQRAFGSASLRCYILIRF